MDSWATHARIEARKTGVVILQLNELRVGGTREPKRRRLPSFFTRFKLGLAQAREKSPKLALAKRVALLARVLRTVAS